MTTLYEFYKKLCSHDWHYQYSDDHRVWSNGQRSQDIINMIAKESPEHRKLCEEYVGHVMGRGPKPVCSPDPQDT